MNVIFGEHRGNLTKVLIQNNGIKGTKKLDTNELDSERDKTIKEIVDDIDAFQKNRTTLDNQLQTVTAAADKKWAYYHDKAVVPFVINILRIVSFNIFSPYRWANHTKTKITEQMHDVDANIQSLESILKAAKEDIIKGRLNDPEMLGTLEKCFAEGEIGPLKTLLKDEIYESIKVYNTYVAIDDKLKNEIIPKLKENLKVLQDSLAENQEVVLLGSKLENNRIFANALLETHLKDKNVFVEFLNGILEVKDNKLEVDNSKHVPLGKYNENHTKILNYLERSATCQIEPDHIRINDGPTIQTMIAILIQENLQRGSKEINENNVSKYITRFNQNMAQNFADQVIGLSGNQVTNHEFFARALFTTNPDLKTLVAPAMDGKVADASELFIKEKFPAEAL